MSLQSRRFKQNQTFEERCSNVDRLREAAILRRGADRDAAVRKARHLEAAAHMSGWLRSSELQPPK
jgi:hypothetical protein